MRHLFLVIFFIISACSVTDDEYSDSKGFGSIISFAEMIPTSDYVIYSDCATLPTLYNAINMFTHTKPSFIYDNRGILDRTKLPSHVQLINSVDEMRNKIAELNQLNPTATFTLYMNDLRSAKMIKYFYSQGISKNRVKGVLLSDGTRAYVEWNIFSGYNGWANWLVDQIRVQDAFKASTDVGKDIFCSGALWTVPTVEANVVYWLQWPELVQTESILLEEHIARYGKRYNKVNPQDYFNSLSAENQNKFMDLFGLHKKWAKGEGSGTLDNQTIGEALSISSKPNIIITGTNPYSPAGTDTDALIEKVKAIYGDKYDYFFKGHPADTTHPSDKSIVVLPFKLPMEAILWVYGDDIQVLGGYESSLYMNADKNIEKFFFDEQSVSTLFAPLDSMYRQGLLGEVKFIN